MIIEHIGLYAQSSHHPRAVREGGGRAGTMVCMFCTMCMWSGCTCMVYTYICCVGGGGQGGGFDRELLVHVQHNILYMYTSTFQRCTCTCIHVQCIHFILQNWTKLNKSGGGPWPEERSDHAAVCLNYGQQYPQLLVTGGWIRKSKPLADVWILDIVRVSWRKVRLEYTQLCKTYPNIFSG